MGRFVAAILLVLGLTGGGGAVAAGPQDFADSRRMKAELAELADPGTTAPLRAAAERIMVGLGLLPLGPPAPDPAPTPEFAATPGALVELVDLRLMLTQIAIQAGAQDHQTLRRAQGGQHQKVILLRGGFVTLADLVDLSRGTPAADHIRPTPEGVILTRPLAIWSDGGLHLGAADRLVMDRPSGSFLVNLGWLDVAGGRISGSAGANLFEPAFRPFLLTAGQGRLTARAATLHGLGFGETAVFGGVSVVNSGLQRAGAASQVSGSALIDVSTLSVLGAQDAVIAGNHLSGTRGTALLVSRSQGVVIAGNTLAGLSGPQAIRITAGSRGIRVIDNVLAGGARTGVLVDQDSADITIGRNQILAPAATGVAVSDSRCVTIGANLIANTGGAGVSIRGSDGIVLEGNAILFSRGAGVLIRNQDAGAEVRLTGNVLRGNLEGLRGATPGLVVLEDNDLQAQLPRLFAGDLAPRMVDWLRDVQAAPAAARPDACAQGDQG